jgi:hypothetical protein
VVIVRRYEGDIPDYFRLRVYFDARGGPLWDHRVVIIFDGGSGGWYACVVHNRKGHGAIGDCDIVEPHADAWKFIFPWRLLNANKPVRWRIQGEDPLTGVGPRDIVDRAPDNGWYPS